MPKTLYEQDFSEWVTQTIHTLQQKEFNSLDIEHLIEELQDLGKSEKRALESNLMILLAHLLKLKVQNDVPETMKDSWYRSIIEHRQRIEKQLRETPSLKSYLPLAINKAYVDGRKLAIKEGKLASFGIPIPQETEYPKECPFHLEQLLDNDFYSQD
ncbi:MAG: DUF29 domain-containing protein [Microcystaceae cyanobacterium]